jgi:hypothetical protein
MTSMAARFSFDEKNRGSIETGKLGDFVVLSDHFLTVSAEQLRHPRGPDGRRRPGHVSAGVIYQPARIESCNILGKPAASRI